MRKALIYEIEIKGGTLFPNWTYYTHRDTLPESRGAVSLLKKRGYKTRIIEYSTDRRIVR